MIVRQIVAEALAPVLENSHYSELPAEPVWPAAVWSISSAPEDQWCYLGGYDSHELNIVFLAKDADEFGAIIASARAALEALPIFQFEEASGDSEYESDPEVYAQFLTVRLRTRR